MTDSNGYRTNVKPVWCSGCGNYGILDAITRKALPALGIPKHQTLINSGIGCSSRIPAYIDTYGLNSIHGRATVIAQGAKLAKPELTVIAIGGEGDFLNIGGGHFPHAVRRNIDITYIMINNFVYALTKGQTSPTTLLSTTGRERVITYQNCPPIDPMLNMISYSASTQLSYIAQELRAARNNALSLVNTPNFEELRMVWTTNRKAMYGRYYDMFKSYPLITDRRLGNRILR